MGSFSLPHLLIVALVVLVLFGRGRISEMMGDFGKGIKSFKAGINDETDRPAAPVPTQLAMMPPVSSPPPQQQRSVAANGDTIIEPGATPKL